MDAKPSPGRGACSLVSKVCATTSKRDVVSKWVNPKQMFAVCLTKEDLRAGDDVRFVLQSGKHQLTETAMADHQIMTDRALARDDLRQKYPHIEEPGAWTQICSKASPTSKTSLPL